MCKEITEFYKNCPVCNDVVYYHLKHNLKSSINKNSSCTKCANNKRKKYTFNENYFEKIDTPEKAYILGFIYADGNVDNRARMFSICLKKDDVGVLNFIKDSLDSNHPIHYYNEKYSTLQITSKKLCTDLINANIIPNKTYKTNTLPYTGEFFSHFLRGFFDGDGSIWCAKNDSHHVGVSFANNLYVLTEIKEFLKKELNVNSCLKYEDEIDNPFACSLRIGGSVQIKKFYDFLYKDDCFSLKRKKDRFLIPIQDAIISMKFDFKYNGMQKKIKELHDNNVRNCDIARTLNLNSNSVNGSIRRMKERKEIL